MSGDVGSMMASIDGRHIQPALQAAFRPTLDVRDRTQPPCLFEWGQSNTKGFIKEKGKNTLKRMNLLLQLDLLDRSSLNITPPPTHTNLLCFNEGHFSVCSHALGDSGASSSMLTLACWRAYSDNVDNLMLNTYSVYYVHHLSLLGISLVLRVFYLMMELGEKSGDHFMAVLKVN